MSRDTSVIALKNVSALPPRDDMMVREMTLLRLLIRYDRHFCHQMSNIYFTYTTIKTIETRFGKDGYKDAYILETCLLMKRPPTAFLFQMLLVQYVHVYTH